MSDRLTAGFRNVISFRFSQPAKAYFATAFTFSGTVSSVSPLWLNAYWPIDFNEDGSLTDCRFFAL